MPGGSSVNKFQAGLPAERTSVCDKAGIPTGEKTRTDREKTFKYNGLDNDYLSNEDKSIRVRWVTKKYYK